MSSEIGFHPAHVCVCFQERLKALTDIVWPEIALLVKKEIQLAKERGETVCTFSRGTLFYCFMMNSGFSVFR